MTPEAKPVVATEATSAAPAATPAPTKKFRLEADTMEELSIAFARTALQAGLFVTMDNKSGNGNKYAVWNLDDGLSVNTFRGKGLGLSEEQARQLPTKDGVPAILSVDIVMRQLTPPSGIKAKIQERQIATVNRENTLLTQLNAVRRAKGLPEIAG